MTDEMLTTEDRREGERRSFERRDDDRRQRIRDALAMVLAICGGLSVVYLFFAAFGAVDPTEAVIASVVAIVLGTVWFAGFWYRMRTTAYMSQRPDRERRGY